MAATNPLPGHLEFGRTAAGQNVPVQVLADGSVVTTGGGGGGGAVTIADGADVTQGAKADAAWTSGNGTVISLLKKIASAGGSAVSIADGSDVAEGAIADTAVTGDNTGTVSGKLRGFNKIWANVWDSVNGWLKVSIQNTSLAITAASLPLPTGAATAAKQPALGTAGSASTDVITVQGIANGVAQAVTTPLVAGPLVGQAKVAVTGTAVQLGSNALSNGVIITAPSSNAAKMTVGGSGVTNTVTGAGNGYILEAGASASFAVSNTNVLYINGTANDMVSFAGS